MIIIHKIYGRNQELEVASKGAVFKTSHESQNAAMRTSHRCQCGKL